MFEIKGIYNTAQVFADSIENEALSQIMNLCNQSWTEGLKIAIMPDCHAGKGCTIGTTMTIKDKVCPNLVGVDIGCGMLTVQLPFTLEQSDLKSLDDFINQKIPSGFSVNKERLYQPKEEDLYLENLRCFNKLKNYELLEKSVGSLGSGNHFIEIDKDDEGQQYLVIHTGSRNLGKQVAEIYQKLADEHCNNQKKVRKLEEEQLILSLINSGKKNLIQSELEKLRKTYQAEKVDDKELCYLEGQSLDDYLHDMEICQHFAETNRKMIALSILNHLFQQKGLHCDVKKQWKEGTFNKFETVHNYINFKDKILRKGAISAHTGEKVLIPINMRDGAIIGMGKGNSEYNYSGPHGAGRLMSRSKAKASINMKEFEDSMKGIYSTSVTLSTLDESPMSYKPMDELLKNITDSIDVCTSIKPIYNYKAH